MSTNKSSVVEMQPLSLEEQGELAGGTNPQSLGYTIGSAISGAWGAANDFCYGLFCGLGGVDP